MRGCVKICEDIGDNLRVMKVRVRVDMRKCARGKCVRGQCEREDS